MDREAIVQLNKDIALHAKRKELDEAMALFKQAVEAKAENSHTYSNALNANIRCGNLRGAEEVLETMKKRGRKRDVIICTTMIKGYCSAGRVNKALALFNDMVERTPIVTPNLRTINTLLRGCVQTGEVATAEALVARAQKDLKIQLDVSSWEYLVALLCQSLKLDKVLPIVGRIKDDASCASGMAGMYVNSARAAAVLGDWKSCRKAITGALASLDKVADSATGAERDNDEEDVALSAAAAKSDKNTGGKRAWNSEEVDARRVESLEVYREHIKAELSAEVRTIEAFMNARKDSKVTPFEYMFPFFLRIFPLAPVSIITEGAAATTEAAPTNTKGGKRDGSSLKKEVVKPIMRAVEENFGLDVFARRLTGKSCDDLNGYSLDPAKAPEVLAAAAAKAAEAKAATKAKKLKKDKKRGKVTSSTADAGATAAAVKAEVAEKEKEKEKPVLTPLEAQIASFRAQLPRVFDSSCKFVFKSVFSGPSSSNNNNSAAATASGERELKVEVCSGAGEWVVAQAKHDPAADWAALELRHDRAHQTLTKAVFAEARNLAVLCGDAMHILPTHFPADSVSRLFVNHPEPPQQTGGRGDSQGRHLLEQVLSHGLLALAECIFLTTVRVLFV
jgi:pentatricopeptide repeat protein